MTTTFAELASCGPHSERRVSSLPDRAPVVFVVAAGDDARRSLEQLIRTTGFDVESCGTPAEFLSSARPAVPCCLLLEVSPPSGYGLDLQRQVAETMDMRIVFITGRPDVPVRSKR